MMSGTRSWPATGDLTSWFVPVLIQPNVWLIAEPGHVNSYLVAGAARAVLIDTGTGIAAIAPVARLLTTKPLSVILTHNHFDHIGGAAVFAQVAIHPAGVTGLRAGRSSASLQPYLAETAALFQRGQALQALDADGFNMLHPEQIVRPLPADFVPDKYAIAPVAATATLADGELIDLGGRTLEVIYTPGHSPDGICLLDRAARILFTADTVYAGPLYTQTPGADLVAYQQSLQRLVALVDAVDLLLPGHNRVPLDPLIINEMAAGFSALAAGGTAIETTTEAGLVRRIARFARFSIILPT